MATTSKLLFEKFLQDLPNCINREMIDRAAQDFCMTHNTKGNRKRLAKVLFSVQRTRYATLFRHSLRPYSGDILPKHPNHLVRLVCLFFVIFFSSRAA